MGEKEREREGEEVVVEDQGGRMCPKRDKMGVTGTLLSGSPPSTPPSLLSPPPPALPPLRYYTLGSLFLFSPNLT